jgi:hypothetical protein
MTPEDFNHDDPLDILDEVLAEYRQAAAEQKRRERLVPMMHDAIRIEAIETYDPGVWDPSNYNAEVRGTWPKEYADASHR